MAIGFIKKIFSFGKDAVEEKPAPPQETAVADEVAVTPPVPSGEQGGTQAPVEEDRSTVEVTEASTDDRDVSFAPDTPTTETTREEGPVSTAVTADENTVEQGESVRHPISPLAGEMPGRAEEGESPSEHPTTVDELSAPASVPSGEQEEREAAAAADVEEVEIAADDRAGGTGSSEDETGASEDESVPLPILPLEGETPGRAEGGEPPSEPLAPSLPKGFAAAERRPREEAPAPPAKLNWYQRLRLGLARTSSQLTGQIASLFTKRKLDEATLQDLEDLLIQADLGVETAMRITDTLASERYGKDVSGEDVSRIMAGEITKVLAPVARPLELDLSHKPHVILVVGVNGTGKTTTIGKLAAKLSGAGLKVMLAAGDTFRAAAIEQLKIWAERTKSEIVSSKLGADAAGLAYEAFQRAREQKADVLIIDTAGRLQNKAELMAELEKIVRVLGKLDPDAPHTVLQTLDATTGQNALQQVEIFRNVAGVSGLIMTKLDGTARGGILVAISAKHKLPVYFIGVGEGIDDLEPFEAKDFAEAIAGVAAP
ncbi:MAG: signal recognition particle-docking protein FtsY [Sinorhizobium meliloti]|uniref:signal recognition particle-docking protein FtsY n=1 Tax=Sinorhizobium TaxID=28105 RepID=UPI00036E24D8|nr:MULTISPECIES: signal recognition particle-docking protein FtsY [Sinorhizobium]MCG5484503.1 signal recognition particle-docking protein FtsY [Sinorhizobium meliloti]PND21270.1 signal recognition particle-docking protein FtsY [Ensifer sp. MMN_5]PND26479.1 signal recognition particle-docking protein FtsY [Sinorhizobium sp. M4_45]RVP98624.1 signal recognition particle-docking protein FtsY [Sinorhizobium meliloti]